MNLVDDRQTLGADGCRDHGDAPRERLEDLDPRAAAGTQRHHARGGTSEFLRHRVHLADEVDHGDVDEVFHLGAGAPDHPDTRIRTAPIHHRKDLAEQDLEGVDVRPVGQVPSEQQSISERNCRRARRRRSFVHVAVRDHSYPRMAEAADVEIATHEHGYRSRGESPLHSRPPRSVHPLHQTKEAVAQRPRSGCRRRGTAVRDLLVLEIIEIDHQRDVVRHRIQRRGEVGIDDPHHVGAVTFDHVGDRVADLVVGQLRRRPRRRASDGRGPPRESGERAPAANRDVVDGDVPQCRRPSVRLGVGGQNADEVEVTASGERIELQRRAQVRTRKRRPGPPRRDQHDPWSLRAQQLVVGELGAHA